MLLDDGDVIAETCRRYINCTVVCMVRANLGYVHIAEKICVSVPYAGV